MDRVSPDHDQARIDHVVIGVNDLGAAASRIRDECGLIPSEPRAWPDLGISHAVVQADVGPSLELAAVDDPIRAAREPWTKSLHHRIERGGGPIAWAVRAQDISHVSQRLGLPIRLGSSGTFSTVGLDQSFETGLLPFFIAWSTPTSDPGYGETCIARLELSGDPDKLWSWLGSGGHLPITFVDGPEGLRAVVLRAEAGEFEIREGW